MSQSIFDIQKQALSAFFLNQLENEKQKRKKEKEVKTTKGKEREK